MTYVIVLYLFLNQKNSQPKIKILTDKDTVNIKMQSYQFCSFYLHEAITVNRTEISLALASLLMLTEQEMKVWGS